MLRQTNSTMPKRRTGTRSLALTSVLSVMVSWGCITEEVAGPNEYIPNQDLEQQTLARRNLGIEYLANGRTAIALRELLAAYDNDPDDPITLLWLGEGYRRRGHDDIALEYMERAMELDPEYQAAHLNLSGFYLQKEMWEKSLPHSQFLINDALYDAPYFAYSNKGWALFKLGRVSEARESFEMALRMRRTYWPANLNLGILEDTAGREKQALKHFERVLRQPTRASATSETNFRVAKLHISMGNRKEAIAHFEAAVEEDPYGDWAEQSRDFLEMLE